MTVLPQGILVVGNTSELDNEDKIRSFELYRRNLRNPEIITYDELFARAKFVAKYDEYKGFDQIEPEDSFDI